MFHYIKMAHYHITPNPSHQMASLIWRHVMSWWDAWGLEEQCDFCGRKSFYCSKHALLNDDDNDNEETFGEYVESTKQLKKIRRRDKMPKRRIPWKWQPRHFSPWYWWIFLWLIFLWLNSFITLFPHISYHSHDDSNVLPHCHPFYCIIIFPWLHYCAYWGCTSWLISDSFLTHIILHAGRIFWQWCHNCIICLVVESALHVYKGQFSPWLG